MLTTFLTAVVNAVCLTTVPVGTRLQWLTGCRPVWEPSEKSVLWMEIAVAVGKLKESGQKLLTAHANTSARGGHPSWPTATKLDQNILP